MPKAHIEEENAGEAVSCILSDGLHELPQDDVDSVVIAGMGGDLSCQNLRAGL